MWPAEHIFGSFLILVLLGLLLFGGWYWSRGLPKKEPTPCQRKIWCVIYCLVAGHFAFKAWEEFSYGVSGWYFWLLGALVMVACAIRDWPKGEVAR